MKRNSLIFAASLAGIALLLLTWQTSRFASLSSHAKRLEGTQEEWVEENRKLESSISVLTNRTRSAAAAPRLGLEKVKPEQRVRVIVIPAEAGK
ncbi:MAG: hypothetical protein Q8O15_04040 [Rectinemataceae bacterium]|nr:hypothetical protein [Rectinemataceae bacterium]